MAVATIAGHPNKEKPRVCLVQAPANCINSRSGGRVLAISHRGVASSNEVLSQFPTPTLRYLRGAKLGAAATTEPWSWCRGKPGA